MSPSTDFATARRRPRHRAELDAFEQAERLRDVGASLLAHEVGETFRQFAFVGFRESAIEHVGHDQPEHVVAEEFEPLVAVAAVARGFQRGDVGEGGRQQRRVREYMADPRLMRLPRLWQRPCCAFSWLPRFAAGAGSGLARRCR